MNIFIWKLAVYWLVLTTYTTDKPGLSMLMIEVKKDD